MHDLESFFWVLFWICVHYDEKGNYHNGTQVKNWRDLDILGLYCEKGNAASNFLSVAKARFTQYYMPLIPVMHELCKVVFPDGKRHERSNRDLYEKMCEVLKEGQKLMEGEAMQASKRARIS